MTATVVQLYFGLVPAPAPREIAESFTSLTVQHSDTGVASGWQITLRADRPDSPGDDAPLVASPLLAPFTRVIASISLGSTTTVLLDGVITHIEMQPGSGHEGGMLTITGDSVDVLLDLTDFAVPWPAMTDPLIVGAVLAKYTELGLMPQISVPVPPPELPDPLEGTVVQNETDAAFIRRLGSTYGYIFYIQPGPVVGTNVAYWGPPPRQRPPQPTLSVAMGPETNVEGLTFAYEAMGPTMVLGTVQSEFLEGEFPVATTEPQRLPPLATRPAVISQLPFVRYQIFRDASVEPVRALFEANSTTQQSTDHVVVATGTVDAARYPHVLSAPGVIGVRGAGATYDGNYYLESVTHHIEIGSYRQDLRLAREGVGTTTMKVAT